MKKKLQKEFGKTRYKIFIVFLALISLWFAQVANAADTADIMAARDRSIHKHIGYSEIVLVRALYEWMSLEIEKNLRDKGFSTAENTILFKTRGYSQNPPKINNRYFKNRFGNTDDVVFFINIKKASSDGVTVRASIYIVPNRPTEDFFNFPSPCVSFKKDSFMNTKKRVLSYINQFLSIKEGDWLEEKHYVRANLHRTPCTVINIETINVYNNQGLSSDRFRGGPIYRRPDPNGTGYILSQY